MPVYETLLARYLDELGILDYLRRAKYAVLSVEKVLDYLDSQTNKAFEAAEALTQFDQRLRALDNVMYQGVPSAHKGMQLQRQILHQKCENALCRVDTLQAIYDMIEEQNEVPLSEIR